MSTYKCLYLSVLLSDTEKAKITQCCRFRSRTFFMGLTLVILAFYIILLRFTPSSYYGEVFIPKKVFIPIQDSPEFSEDLTCRIPRLDPYDPTIRHLLEPPDDVDCSSEFPYLFNSTNDFQLVPQDTFQKNKTLGIVSCCYRRIERGYKKDNQDNSYTFEGECSDLSLEYPTQLNINTEEFVAIFCDKKKNHGKVKKDDEDLIVDTHAFVPLKPHVEERIEEYYSQVGGKGSFLKEEERLNVVILGIDGTSHMNFLRVMPKSYDFLMNKLDAVEYHGMNKVGDNTYPNMAAVLTNRNTSELNETCEVNKAFDACPLIWKDYESEGFRTSFGEDAPWMGMFNYLKKGFIHPPTDYYLRPFAYATEKVIASHKAKLCYGPRLTFQVLLDYMQKFAYTMGKDKRYFQFIWATSLTHDNLMKGKLGDLDLLSTLQFFQEGGYLNNTAFILMSDHGIRWGKIRTYLQGYLEERLPFLYFILPQWFKEKYKRAFQNLKQNQDILTTPFDLHQTLEDLRRLEQIHDEKLLEREGFLKIAENRTHLPRGISQFLPLPKGRTCQEAGIEEHFCTCRSISSISADTPVIRQAVNYLVFNINQMVSKYSQCAYLTLKEVLSAGTLENNAKAKDNKKDFGTYQILIKTNPGDALFEASVIRDKHGNWRLGGTIQRINLYGDQSHCVDEKEIKMYCYCVDNLKLTIEKDL